MFLSRSQTRSATTSSPPSSPTPTPPVSPTSSTFSVTATKVRQTISTLLLSYAYWPTTVPLSPTPTRSKICVSDISPPTLKTDYVKLDIYGRPILNLTAERPLSSHGSSETVASSGAASSLEVEEEAGEAVILERFMKELSITETDEAAFKERNAPHLHPLTPSSRVTILESEMALQIEAERVALLADTPSLGAAPVFSAATKSKSKAVAAHDAAYERILAGLTTRERETVRAREKVFKGLLLGNNESL